MSLTHFTIVDPIEIKSVNDDKKRALSKLSEQNKVVGPENEEEEESQNEFVDAEEEIDRPPGFSKEYPPSSSQLSNPSPGSTFQHVENDQMSPTNQMLPTDQMSPTNQMSPTKASSSPMSPVPVKKAKRTYKYDAGKYTLNPSRIR